MRAPRGAGTTSRRRTTPASRARRPTRTRRRAPTRPRHPSRRRPGLRCALPSPWGSTRTGSGPPSAPDAPRGRRGDRRGASAGRTGSARRAVSIETWSSPPGRAVPPPVPLVRASAYTCRVRPVRAEPAPGRAGSSPRTVEFASAATGHRAAMLAGRAGPRPPLSLARRRGRARATVPALPRGRGARRRRGADGPLRELGLHADVRRAGAPRAHQRLGLVDAASALEPRADPHGPLLGGAQHRGAQSRDRGGHRARGHPGAAGLSVDAPRGGLRARGALAHRPPARGRGAPLLGRDQEHELSRRGGGPLPRLPHRARAQAPGWSSPTGSARATGRCSCSSSNRPDVEVFRPAHEIDPAYGAGLARAVASGVEVLPLRALLSREGVRVGGGIPFLLERA